MDSSENVTKEGGISVATEHIFPVIKKWLYSEKEIFLRELVSNACDAVTKLKRLEGLAQYTPPAGETYRVDVFLDEDAKTLTVSDNGIGMSEEEVEKYICQIALSGALDFIEKYEGDGSGGKEGDGIIGHFGLGFYSAFMVASEVEILSRSYDGSPTVHWRCDDGGSYAFTAPERERSRGTDVILHINEEEDGEYLSRYRVDEVLRKYCAFMPVEIYLHSAKEDEEKAKAKEKEKKKAGEKDGGEAPAEPKPINNPSPLWMKPPSSCTDEEYKAFYRDVFHDWREPLFWIHLDADYPLNFKGILYFPRLASEYEPLEGQVKLYYNQVFVADNIKEVIPEYLLMLRGVLDCPELPLNVSRSYLQNTGYVAKISSHIVKKVADKLCSLCRTDREHYESLWRDLKMFVEYASLRDEKFYERVKDCVLLEKVGGGFVTPEEYLEAAKETHEGVVYYATDPVAQAQYISLYQNEGIDVVLLDKVVDTQFLSVLEREEGEGKDKGKMKFVRVDAETAESLKGEGGGKGFSDDRAEALFRRVSGNDKLSVSFTALKDEGVPALLNVAEEGRRVSDMMRLYGMSGAPDEEASLLLNSASPLVRRLFETPDDERRESAAKQIWSLAVLTRRPLTADELKSFLEESYKTIERGL